MKEHIYKKNVHYKLYIIVLLSVFRKMLIFLSTNKGGRQGNKIWTCFFFDIGEDHGAA